MVESGFEEGMVKRVSSRMGREGGCKRGKKRGKRMVRESQWYEDPRGSVGDLHRDRRRIRDVSGRGG